MPASAPTTSGPHRPIVVCPLRFEQRALARLGIAERCHLCCCGPGDKAVRRWAETIEPGDRPVVLAGLAGALRTDRPAGSACIITEVRGPEGERIIPPWPGSAVDDSSHGYVGPAGSAAPPASRVPRHARAETSYAGVRDRLSAEACGTGIVTSAPIPVRRAEEKVRLADEIGADLVDLESRAFAVAATSRGWRWGIVRGISDAANTDLPGGIERWVDGAGRLRWPFVLAAMSRRPALLGPLLRLRRDAWAAMRAVAGRIAAELG